MTDLCIGVMGGMGPFAAIDFVQRILSSTGAEIEQNNFRVLLDNNPKIPNRNHAIAGTGVSPVPMLESMAKGLERAGADFLVIPCNTAHAFHAHVAAAVRIPVVDMIEVVCEALKDRIPSVPVGLLLAQGARDAGLYDVALGHFGIPFVHLDRARQDALMALIYSIKSGLAGAEEVDMAQALVASLVATGAGMVVAGCTELPLVLRDGETACPILDSTQILVERTIAHASGVIPLPR